MPAAAAEPEKCPTGEEVKPTDVDELTGGQKRRRTKAQVGTMCITVVRLGL